MKNYGRYRFPFDSIVDYKINLRRYKIMLNNLKLRLYFSWIIDIPWTISCMNAYFNKKRQLNILGKFQSDSNVRNSTHYCEFSNVLLRHATRMLAGMSERTVLHFYVRSWMFACLVSLAGQHENWSVVFLLSQTPVRLNHCIQSVWMFLLSE